MHNLETYQDALFLINPDEDDFELQMDDFIDQLPEQYHQAIIPSLFEFFERYPSNENGCPGTFTHFIEDFYPEYNDLLLASLARQPSISTVTLANRMLNDAKLGLDLRQQLMACLVKVANNNHAEIATLAQDYLDYQLQK